MNVYLYDAALNIIDVPCTVEDHGDRFRVVFGPFKEKVWPFATQFEGEKPVPIDKVYVLGPSDTLTVSFDRPLKVNKQTVVIDYTNWRGERRMRHIWPRSINFRSTEWHPEPQWLITAIDMDDQQEKAFPLKDIHDWAVPV